MNSVQRFKSWEIGRVPRSAVVRIPTKEYTKALKGACMFAAHKSFDADAQRDLHLECRGYNKFAMNAEEPEPISESQNVIKRMQAKLVELNAVMTDLGTTNSEELPGKIAAARELR